MKKTLCIILLIGVGFQATMAKESESKNKKEMQEQITPRRSDRKIIELKKVITISPTQEETI